jgi:hypothetical protein
MKIEQNILNLEDIEKFKESLFDTLKNNTLVIKSNVENEDIIIELASKDTLVEVTIDNQTKAMSINEFEKDFLNFLYNDIKSDLIVLSLKQTNNNDK